MSTHANMEPAAGPPTLWIPMPIHDLILHHLSAVADGKQNLVITGPKGVGKTEAVRWALEEFSRRESRRPKVRSDEVPPRGWLYFAAGAADGRKTALRDLLSELGHRVGSAQSKHLTVRDLTVMAVKELRGVVGERNIRLVCIDEADGIDASNLNDLRQVIDRAQQERYPMGVVLIGNGKVLQALAKNEELGQRFSLAIEFSSFKEESIRTELPKAHPDLRKLSETPVWDELLEGILDTAQGSIRRLDRLLSAAHSFAAAKETGIDDTAIWFAIRSLGKGGD